MNYAEEDFSQQLLSYGESTVLGKYVYNEYKVVGIDVGYEEEVENTKIYLGKLYEKVESMRDRIDNIIKYGLIEGSIEQKIKGWEGNWKWDPRFIDIDVLNEINYVRDLLEKLDILLKSAEYGVITCYNNKYQCDELLSNIDVIVNHNENYDASGVVDVAIKARDTEPISAMRKVYIMEVECGGTELSKYGGRMIMPIGGNRYYEDTIYRKVGEEGTEQKFFNLYRIEASDDKERIDRFEVSIITSKIGEYRECGEYSRLDGSMRYEGIIYNIEETKECVKALCGETENNYITVGLYESESPL